MVVDENKKCNNSDLADTLRKCTMEGKWQRIWKIFDRHRLGIAGMVEEASRDNIMSKAVFGTICADISIMDKLSATVVSKDLSLIHISEPTRH